MCFIETHLYMWNEETLSKSINWKDIIPAESFWMIYDITMRTSEYIKEILPDTSLRLKTCNSLNCWEVQNDHFVGYDVYYFLCIDLSGVII